MDEREDENIKLIDENDNGEKLYSMYMEQLDADISVLVEPDGTEWYPGDFQGYQPKTIEETAYYNYREASTIND